MERLWWVSFGMAWLLVVAQGLTLGSLLWVVGRIHLKRALEGHVLVTDDGPEVHTAMPEVEGEEIGGRRLRTTEYRGREVALLLLSPECAPCERLLREFRKTQRGLWLPMQFLVVLEASREVAAGYQRRYRLNCPVITDEEATIRTVLGVDRTPYGFLLDQEGIVRMKGVVNDRGQLEGLLRRRGRLDAGMLWHEPEQFAEGIEGAATEAVAAELR